MPKLVPDLNPGERFNSLVVQKEVIEKKGRGKSYECLCDCGGMKTVNKADLRNSRVKSCGCIKSPRKDVVGKTFNYMKVDEYAYTNKHRVLHYNCTCLLCNNKFIIESGMIGIQKSCGCYQYNKAENTRYVTGKYFSVIRQGAERRKHEFNIERGYLDDLFEKQNKKCALTGLDLNFEVDKNRSGQIASLDRIDSSIGYVPENVQWVHKDINLMKGGLQEDYFVCVCRIVSGLDNQSLLEKFDKETNKKARIKNDKISGGYFSRLKILAARRNLSFNVTPEYLMSVFNNQNRKCVFSGVELNFNHDMNQNYQTASLDRIDPDIGYEQGNLQWVHKDINIMRNAFSVEDFLRYCKLVAEHNP